MLVLTRKLNQSIMVGDEIEIKIIEIKHGQVKIGVTAPRNVKVHRSEVYEEIQKENLRASQAKPENLGKLSDLLKNSMKGKARKS
ncbi:MAG: carbon storage regulator [Candidatus Wallbacteria bacterium HGW-Wallbacteria-1]|jgi:carbon storage regulator|uniref:Translational regulator CsrA n=1 Tax=Candidatus Wallbacteria bacterium HGW-Wallbacteria-1 TaxID=2013854 RepID=A0A2N1PUJ6_9BACT|nr:MAG: carbon storage regulator [Candidatus Wallbacteria bacterium HGW-Wallbacteria-1]